MPKKTAAADEPQVVRRVIEDMAPTGAEQRTESKPTFWEYEQSLTPKDWEHHIVYLTREEPKTGIKGMGGYLTKISQPFTIEDVKRAWGGYEFSYIMNRDGKILYSGRFKVEAEPKYDESRETVAGSNGDRGQNAIVGQFVDVLREELARSRESANPASEEAIKLLSAASTRAMDIVLKQVPQQGSPISQLGELVTAAKNLGLVGGGNGGGGGIAEVVTLLKTLGLIKDPMEQIKTQLEMMKLFDDLRGESRGGKRDWKETLVEKVGDALPRVFEEVGKNREAEMRIVQQRFEAARALRGGPPATRPGVPAPVPPAPQPNQMPSISAGLPIESFSPGAPMPAEAPAAAPPPDAPEVTFLKKRMVQMFLADEEAEIIVDFLEAGIPGFCNDLLTYSNATLTDFLGRDPLFADAVKNPRWPLFLSEARAYLSEENDEEKKLN
ncbi:MAG TPA: hypothetical protein VNJ12_13190 [Candidatus Dormibacteraeota bacterium]|nr:hypothetical protein [Candidatus Dormibacteraeota bacterium]